MFRNQFNTQKYMTKYMKGNILYPIHTWKLGDGQIKNIVRQARQGRVLRYPDTTITKYISNSILRQWDRPHVMYQDKSDRHCGEIEVYKLPITHPFVQHVRKRAATYKLTEDYLERRDEQIRLRDGSIYRMHEAIDQLINVTPARLSKGFNVSNGYMDFQRYMLDPRYFNGSIATAEIYPPTDDDFERHLEDWSKRRIESYPCWMEHIK